jgi:hypothetical protein
MSNFKDRLWEELVREHGARLASEGGAAGKSPRRSRPRVLAGTTLGLVGLGTATALLLGAASSSPAFAVSQGRDGTVAVTIKAVRGISGANARLAQIGVHARAVQVAPGCPAPVPPGALRGAATRLGAAPGKVHIAVTTRFDPRRIPPGRTLLVPVVPPWGAGGHVQIAPGRVVRGRPPACLPFTPPPLTVQPGQGQGGRPIQCRPLAPPAGRGGLPGLPHGLPRLPPLPGPPGLMHCRGGGRDIQCTVGPPRGREAPRQGKP